MPIILGHKNKNSSRAFEYHPTHTPHFSSLHKTHWTRNIFAPLQSKDLYSINEMVMTSVVK